MNKKVVATVVGVLLAVLALVKVLSGSAEVTATADAVEQAVAPLAADPVAGGEGEATPVAPVAPVAPVVPPAVQ